MNRSELSSLLGALGVDPRVYSLDGGSSAETVNLEPSCAGIWYVFYSERGERSLEQSFAREDDACRYFLRLLKEAYGFAYPALQEIDTRNDE